MRYIDIETVSAEVLRHIAAAKDARNAPVDPDGLADEIAQDLEELGDRKPGLRFHRKHRTPPADRVVPVREQHPSLYVRSAVHLFEAGFDEPFVCAAVISAMLADGHDPQIARSVAALIVANHRGR